MVAVRAVFKCSVCNEDKTSLENLEVHIWACHLRSFPYRCALCGYPALTSKALASHYEDHHEPSIHVEFKRRVDQEMQLRNMISESIFFPVEEQIFGEIDVVDDSVSQVHHYDDLNDVVEMNSSEYEDASDKTHLLPDEEHVVCNAAVAHVASNAPTQASYEVFDEGSFTDAGSDEKIEFVDEDGNPLRVEEVIVNDFAQASVSPQSVPAELRCDSVVSHPLSRTAEKSKRRPPMVHQCEDCGKILKYPSKIAEHRRSHTGERPHTCSWCGTSFSQKGTLKCHMRLHTGEKPYSCTWECGRSFVSSSARQMHEKKHTGEKAFSCNECGRLFGKRFHLLRHITTQHQDREISSPTGLDAAGEHAAILHDTVEAVIESVRMSKLKRKSQPITWRIKNDEP